MLILGIDPGLARLGFALLKKEGERAEYVTCGVIKTEKEEERPYRLALLYDSLLEICREYHPDVMSVEKVFFSRNAKSALDIGEVRGVVLLLGRKEGLTIYEYTPLEVKETVTGYGKADKQQVKKMLKILLKLDRLPGPTDASDALALAFCCMQRERFDRLLKDGGEMW